MPHPESTQFCLLTSLWTGADASVCPRYGWHVRARIVWAYVAIGPSRPARREQPRSDRCCVRSLAAGVVDTVGERPRRLGFEAQASCPAPPRRQAETLKAVVRIEAAPSRAANGRPPPGCSRGVQTDPLVYVPPVPLCLTGLPGYAMLYVHFHPEATRSGSLCLSGSAPRDAGGEHERARSGAAGRRASVLWQRG
jgi:hypothetical protein